MSFAIVTDSSANLPNEIIDQYGSEIASLVFRVEDRVYLSYEKGQDNDLKRFYTMMRNKEDVKTSCIEAARCKELFERLLDQGQDVLYLGFSSALSATYQVAQMVLEQLRPKYPHRKIYHVDTLAASLGEGLLVLHAARQREQGKSIEEVYNWQLDNRLRLCHWFTVEDLFFLKRGGRVSAATAVLGTMLGIKPVLHVDNEGRLINVAKARGRKNSLDALVKHMEETVENPAEQTICISHGDCIEDAQYVAEQVQKKIGVKDVVIHYVDPVVGAHSGPGTVALFFLGSRR